MIQTKQELRECLREDLKWHHGKKPGLRDWLFNSEWLHIYRYIKSLRYYEYYENNKGGCLLFKFLLTCHKLRHHRLCTRYNIRIWPNTIGPGLYIPHLGTIFVSNQAQIGRNFIIRPGCCIGHIKATHSGKTVIGDNVEFSLGVKVFGNIKIGREAIVNGNAVITQNIPPYAIVMGNPAKVTGFKMMPEEVIEHEKQHYHQEERLPVEKLEGNYEKYYVKRRKQILELLK